MSDQTALTITVAVTTRTAMNTATPRFGDWTYHHVLPVRLYFMTAWTMLHVCKHTDCWKSTRTAGRQALLSMCQNTANKDTIKLFLDVIDDAPAGADIASRAKLCASPPFGGFGGPNPGQRTDDPHDGVERFAPVSAPNVWWSSVTGIGATLRDAFGLNAMPQPNTNVAMTRKVAEWCAFVEAIAKAVSVAEEAGGAHGIGFNQSDWCIDDGKPWTMLPQPRPLGGDPDIPLALRRKTAAVTYFDRTTATPQQLQGAWRLGRYEDKLKIPAPPLLSQILGTT